MRARYAIHALVAVALSAFVLGCAPKASNEKTATQVSAAPSDTSPTGQAREAGRIVVEIQKDPNRAGEILTAHGTTVDAFEELLYKIAQDSALTEAYEAARTGAS
jgi:hypothetical protein